MSESMEVTMLKSEIESMKKYASMARSATLNVFIELKIQIEEGDYDEALETLTELTE